MEINNENITFEKAYRVATSRMLYALGAYYIWKWISNAINTNGPGGEAEANRIVKIFNTYGAVFQQLKISTYKSFVADIAIFFDKNGYEDNFSLEKLLVLGQFSDDKILDLRNKIKEIKKKHGASIGFIQELRNADVGHQEINPKDRHLIFKDIEELFVAVQEILNLISNSHDRSVQWWNHIKEETDRQMKWIADNLERGEAARLKEIDEKYKINTSKGILL